MDKGQNQKNHCDWPQLRSLIPSKLSFIWHKATLSIPNIWLQSSFNVLSLQSLILSTLIKIRPLVDNPLCQGANPKLNTEYWRITIRATKTPDRLLWSWRFKTDKLSCLQPNVLAKNTGTALYIKHFILIYKCHNYKTYCFK